MKRKKIFNVRNLLIAFIIVLTPILIYFIYFDKKDLTDSQKFKNEYEILNNTKNDSGKTYRELSIPTSNPIIYSTADNILDKINNKETFVVYFGYAKCPWCRSVISSLLKAASDLNLDRIYYVDVEDIRDVITLGKDNKLEKTKQGTKAYNELLDKLSDVLDDYTLTDSDGKDVSTNEKRIYAPNVVAVINGKAKELSTGISPLETDPYMTLTKKMTTYSYNSFKCIIKCAVDASNTCSADTSC